MPRASHNTRQAQRLGVLRVCLLVYVGFLLYCRILLTYFNELLVVFGLDTRVKHIKYSIMTFKVSLETHISRVVIHFILKV